MNNICNVLPDVPDFRDQIGSKIPSSSFFGLFTRGLIGQAFILSAGNGLRSSSLLHPIASETTVAAFRLLASMAHLGSVTDFLPFPFIQVRELCPAARSFTSHQTLMPEGDQSLYYVNEFGPDGPAGSCAGDL